ncbi:MAG: diguanylate cyclase [Eubacteriaceae bacterium]|nr:diguanylate cyclase [Eubacteriaceae bacterium]
MGFTGIILLNLYSASFLLVMIIYTLSYGEKNNPQQKLFLYMLKINFLLLIFDIFGRFDGHLGTIYPFLNTIGNFTIFLINPILPSLWLMYAYNHSDKTNKSRKVLLYFIVLIFIINTAILITSQFNGCLYSIDENNIYHRGPLFWFDSVVMLAIVIVAYAAIIQQRKIIERQYYHALLFFAVPPFISLILQIFIYGVSLVYNSIAFSLFIVLLNIQNRSIHIDYLTGLNNRKKLDVYLNEKISLATEANTFSLIMADINNFKVINDLYGHAVGDDALEVFARLLKNCLRTTDFTARYGGDEFVIILDVTNKKDLLSTVGRINLYFRNFNKNSLKPYKLELSMGYEVYDVKSQMRANDFLKHVDLLMYKNKQKIKERENLNKAKEE